MASLGSKELKDTPEMRTCTSLIRSLDQVPTSFMYYSPPEVRKLKDTFYWPKGVHIEEVPL